MTGRGLEARAPVPLEAYHAKRLGNLAASYPVVGLGTKQEVDELLDTALREELLKRVGKGQHILDIGCGAGSWWYEDAGKKFWAVDVSRSPDLPSYVDFQLGSAESLPFDDDAFDLLIYNHVMEHVQDVAHSVREAARVVRPSGWVYLSIPDGFSFGDELYRFLYADEGGHINRFSLAAMTAYLEVGGLQVEAFHEWLNDFRWVQQLLPFNLDTDSLVAMTRSIDHRLGTDFGLYGWAVFARPGRQQGPQVRSKRSSGEKARRRR